MIVCQICHKKFKSIITNSHLRGHGMSTSEYKDRFGQNSLSSLEYREKRSARYTGESNPHYGKSHSSKTRKKISQKRVGKTTRTGPITGKALDNIRDGIQRRENRYRNGELIRNSTNHSPETREKISNAVTSYAQNNKDEMRDRAKRAYRTRLESGNPLSFAGGSHTPEAKQKMKSALLAANEKKSRESREVCTERINELNLRLLNDISENSLQLQCKNCDTLFSFTRQYFTDSKFNPRLCPGCFPRNIVRSQNEMELYSFIASIEPSAIANDRSQIFPLELDVFIPRLRIGFEFSGLYWHSESSNLAVGRVKAYDNYKRCLASDRGIRLYTIFEDEWINQKEIVKSRIKNILGVGNGKRIYARNCRVDFITSKDANKFLRKNHLQGSGRSNVRIGLFLDAELVSVMTFSKNNISRKVNEWEINRFCSKIDSNVVGGASKMFKHFIKNHSPETVISYADSRWSDGELYRTMGFDLVHQTPPNYWYFRPNEMVRKHRYSLRKNSSDKPELTEYENRLEQGYLRIWDCGSSKWRWAVEYDYDN